ncbi:hypothetical protein [Aquimarina pacifica]|uniref:hypothetical protein n=1 Tax=Aquimarina pacifica TaxID=1296415 RepID=UPI00046ECFB2|nr:hypothetical protein [Aquimarina pacifica]
MKKLLLITLLLVSNTIVSQSQKIESNQSNAEIFSAKSGTLIEKQFIDIGKSNKINLQIIKYTDMISGDSISALLIENTSKNQYYAGMKAILDSDEIDGLIKSIKIINEEVLNIIPKNYTEVTYKSRSDLKAGCFWYNKKWSLYMQLDKRDFKTNIKLNREEMLEISELLTKVITQL